jgi:hypothetical protein
MGIPKPLKLSGSLYVAKDTDFSEVLIGGDTLGFMIREHLGWKPEHLLSVPEARHGAVNEFVCYVAGTKETRSTPTTTDNSVSVMGDVSSPRNAAAYGLAPDVVKESFDVRSDGILTWHAEPPTRFSV